MKKHPRPEILPPAPVCAFGDGRGSADLPSSADKDGREPPTLRGGEGSRLPDRDNLSITFHKAPEKGPVDIPIILYNAEPVIALVRELLDIEYDRDINRQVSSIDSAFRAQHRRRVLEELRKLV